MTADGASGVRSLDDETQGITSRPDWHLLRNARLESVVTSPDAFLAYAAQLEAKPLEYWQEEIRSSTWVVVQGGNKILGIAAAKPPGGMDNYAHPEEACFIESVWIAPSMRRSGVGERLVTYLIEERRKVGIQRFYLWVIDHNIPAIDLYDRTGFKRTGRSGPLPARQGREIQYLLAFDSDVIDDYELERNVHARELDRKRFGITYRLLGSAADQGSLARS